MFGIVEFCYWKMSVFSKLQSKTFLDHIANLQNDAWWEGQGMHLMHCGKEKDEIGALDLPIMHHFRD